MISHCRECVLASLVCFHLLTHPFFVGFSLFLFRFPLSFFSFPPFSLCLFLFQKALASQPQPQVCTFLLVIGFVVVGSNPSLLLFVSHPLSSVSDADAAIEAGAEVAAEAGADLEEGAGETEAEARAEIEAEAETEAGIAAEAEETGARAEAGAEAIPEDATTRRRAQSVARRQRPRQ